MTTKQDRVWQGLPVSTWLWCLYDMVLTAFCSYNRAYVLAILLAVVTVFQVLMAARLAYWTEQVRLQTQQNEEGKHG